MLNIKYLTVVLFASALQCRKVKPTYINSTIVWAKLLQLAIVVVANSNDLQTDTLTETHKLYYHG